jgi:hypothetical protein
MDGCTDRLDRPVDAHASDRFRESLRSFTWRGASTAVGTIRVPTIDGTVSIETFTNEFWTARQRAAHSLHEISYRACFKPQLPRFFIDRLTQPREIVYDPFLGRGTTLIEAALMGRQAWGCDVNPLSRILCEPRLNPPTVAEVRQAIAEVDLADAGTLPDELLVFYHPDTLRQICALRKHLLRKQADGTLTPVDRWLRMVAVNRLTGHSAGFFSVYTLPPNQAVSVRSQTKINDRLKQAPPRRDVPTILLRKTRSLLRDCAPTGRARVKALASHSRILIGVASTTPELETDSVTLVVTSPPFLDVVDYRTDNWLRCWFCGIDAASVPVTMCRQLDDWRQFVTEGLREVRRVLRPGGHVAFEVGEVKGGAVRLEETVIPAGMAAGLRPELVLVNTQRFTKTANCWGVANNSKGTNTNRVVLFRKTA